MHLFFDEHVFHIKIIKINIYKDFNNLNSGGKKIPFSFSFIYFILVKKYFLFISYMFFLK